MYIPVLLVLAFCKALNTEDTSSVLATVTAVVAGFCERKRECFQCSPQVVTSRFEDMSAHSRRGVRLGETVEDGLGVLLPGDELLQRVKQHRLHSTLLYL